MHKHPVSEIGVVIGRFQSPFLHDGHLELLRHVTMNHPRVFVFIGQSPLKCTANDPLDFNTRRAMIEESFPDVEVYKIDDIGDDKKWCRELDRQISLLTGPGQTVKLYGSRDSFIKCYSQHGKYPHIEMKPSRYISASDIRQSIGIKSKHTQQFREGVVWAVQNQYPKVYPTVDIVALNPLNGAILLGKKPNESLWRFPGGFSDIASKTYEEDAARELVEETHLVAKTVKYIGSTLVDDWRYKGQCDKIKTMLFVTTDFEGDAVAGDDLGEVKWFKYQDVDKSMMVHTHHPLLDMFKAYIDEKIQRGK